MPKGKCLADEVNPNLQIDRSPGQRVRPRPDGGLIASSVRRRRVETFFDGKTFDPADPDAHLGRVSIKAMAQGVRLSLAVLKSAPAPSPATLAWMGGSRRNNWHRPLPC